MISKLPRKLTEKPWGRTDVPQYLTGLIPTRTRIGEVEFEADDDDELLVKYLFTSEPLSVQVHPGDQAARHAGLARGKDEAWIILSAEPNASIAMGFSRLVTSHAVEAAA